MTVKIAGFWENAWQAPLNEFDLWIHPLREFGIDEMHMVPNTGINSVKSRVHEYDDLEYILNKFPELPRVFVDEAADTSLTDFVHPADALYIFGKTSLAPYKIYAQPGDHVVKIDTVTNNGGFWSHQAASMLLYDRFTKGL
jgi:tRNA(Leu) C34 or U34 (ribose-2'-O)-methylase TrmL